MGYRCTYDSNHADALGSIMALTDENGTVKTQYNYTPFGDVEVTGESSDNPFMFTGREYDGDTGLYYYRARYYSPELARFISEDPIGLAGGINMYAYVGNNPLNFVDPRGLLRVIDYGLTASERAKFEAGLAVLKTALKNNPCGVNYFSRFGIDIMKALEPGHGPYVSVVSTDIVMSVILDNRGAYYPLSNAIELYMDNNATSDEVAHTLVHELGHWANDTASLFGDLNPSTSGLQQLPSWTQYTPDIKRGDPYGYHAQQETLGNVQ